MNSICRIANWKEYANNIFGENEKEDK